MASQKSYVKGKKPSNFAIEGQNNEVNSRQKTRKVKGPFSQFLEGIKEKMAKKVNAQKNATAAKSTVKPSKTADGSSPVKKSKSKSATGSATSSSGQAVMTTENVLSAATIHANTATAPMSSPIISGESSVDPDEIVLTDAEGRRYCRATDCDQVGTVDGYCRYHYLYFWKKIQVRKKILADGKLERYIDELTARYTDKFIELLRKDLRTEKDFLAAVQELELDDSASSSPQDEDEAKSYLEEISGVASESSSRDDDGY